MILAQSICTHYSCFENMVCGLWSSKSLLKKPNASALLCLDQKVSHFFPFAAKRGSWLLLAVELAIYILKENCVLETFDVTELKENLFSVYFLLFPYPKNFSQFFSSHWKK